MLAPLRRPLAAFVGLWFLLVMIEPEAVHSCSVHGAKASVAAGHPGHHMSGGEQHESQKSREPVCSCPGDCTASSFNALPQSLAHIQSSVAFRAELRIPIETRPYVNRADLLLPFAIGPPAIPA
jgi:hypothetical protein